MTPVQAPLLRAEGVSKKFCRSLRRSLRYGLADLARELSGSGRHNRTLRPDEFWAVDDVSFDLHAGDCLGLIGHNGAGKTTLLRMLTGLIKPDRGRIETRGRVAALIALGAGFSPVLSGRENIYVNGALLGLSKRDIERKIDWIVDFSGLAAFIDAPVQSYSSGMTVRLGFAIAAAVEPDVLILDEVLAVGDMAFRAKCYQRLNEIKASGGALILVTHSMEQVVHHCNRAILLGAGRVLADGVPVEVSDIYQGLVSGASDFSRRPFDSGGVDGFERSPYFLPSEKRWGDGKARIVDVAVRQADVLWPASIVPGSPVSVQISVEFFDTVCEPVFGIFLRNAAGDEVLRFNSLEAARCTVAPRCSGERVMVVFEFTPRVPEGDYFLSVGVAGAGVDGIVPHDRRYDSMKVSLRCPRRSDGAVEFNPSVDVVVLP